LVIVKAAAFLLNSFHANIVSIGKFSGFDADLVCIATFAARLPAVVGGSALVGEAFEAKLAFSSGATFVFAGEIFALTDNALAISAFFVGFAVFVGVARSDAGAGAAIDFFAIFEVWQSFTIIRVVATFSASKGGCIANFACGAVFTFQALHAFFTIFVAYFFGGVARAIGVGCTFSVGFCWTTGHDSDTQKQKTSSARLHQTPHP